MVPVLTVPSAVYVLALHKRLITATTILVTCIGITYCVIKTPRYQASASMVAEFTPQPSDIANAAPNNLGITPAPLDHEEIINSYVLELSSGELLRRVVDEIGPDRLYPPSGFNPLAAVYALVSPAAPLNPTDRNERAVQDAVERLQKKDLTVTAERNANVVSVVVSNPDRQLAVRLTQRLIDLFLAEEAQIGRNPRLGIVRSQADIYKQRVSDAQAAMLAFKQANHISSMGEERTALIQERSLVEQSTLAQESKAAESRTRTAVLVDELRKLSPAIMTVQNDRDPMELGARTNLSDLQARQSRFQREFGGDSPAVAEARSSVQSAEQLLQQATTNRALVHGEANAAYQQIQIEMLTAKADWDAATASAAAQHQQLDEINHRLEASDAVESTYQDLSRTYDLADQSYRFFLQNVQAALTSEDLNRAKVTSLAVFNDAYAPPKPVRPGLAVVILAFLGGLSTGIMLAFLREALDETVHVPRPRGASGLPALGSATMG